MALPTEFFGTPSVPHLVIQVGKDGRVFLLNADDMGGYLTGPRRIRRGAAAARSLRRRVGTPRGLRRAGRMGVHPRERRWRQPGGLRLDRRAARRTAAGPRRPERRILRLRLGIADRHQQRHHRRQRGRVGHLRGENGRRAQLRAYGAIPEGGTLPLLWSGSIGTASKFSVPTASEGRVYVGTRNGSLEAFGSTSQGPLQAAPVELGTSPWATPAPFGCRSRPPGGCA